jgi:hypothetical protein
MQKLAQSGVQVHLGASVDGSIKDHFDTIVLAAYAYNNSVLAAISGAREMYQFEVCEKPVVSLPSHSDGPTLSSWMAPS